MSTLALFEEKQVRRAWNQVEEKWYFSIDDVVEVLTASTNVKDYVKKLRKRDSALEAYWGTNCPLVAMPGADGKIRPIRAANAEGLLRLIQSIPSPKAEPFKLWLAKVGYERMQEMADPALSLNRARETWQQHGRSDKWIQQRMTGQETRNKLTDYWKESGVEKADEFALLTNIIHQEWTGLSMQAHK
jgi:prophage antirepressor-like protein